MLLYMEFAGIHHKLLKQGLFNLSQKTLDFRFTDGMCHQRFKVAHK